MSNVRDADVDDDVECVIDEYDYKVEGRTIRVRIELLKLAADPAEATK